MKIVKKVYSKLKNEIILVEDAVQNSPKTVLITGVMHGDEPQGKFLIEKYLQEKHILNNSMFFIPCLNPDGLVLNRRQNSNFVDLNRNFPTSNWKLTTKNEFWGGESSSSEIETRFLENVISEITPDIILTLHAPYKVVNFDGPAEIYAIDISRIINYPVQKDIGYSTPGSFGTFAGIERNIPTITLELDENCAVEELILPCFKIFDYLGNVN